MAYRTEIERALDEMISDETGKKFQGLAVVHAKQKWPQLVACERNWDGGLDAYASAELDSEETGHWARVLDNSHACEGRGRCERSQKELSRTARANFFNPERSDPAHCAAFGPKSVLDKFGLKLVVVPREEFITWLLDPANSDICRDQLGIAPSMTPDLAPAFERAHEAAKDVADSWDRTFRRSETAADHSQCGHAERKRRPHRSRDYGVAKHCPVRRATNRETRFGLLSADQCRWGVRG